MAFTPKKSVHWDASNPSPSEFCSPSIGNDSSESVFATSTLEYVNSQLVAHGYVPAPGLCLDGTSNRDSERVIKCLLSLLGQRMEDMSRTEELSTKLRTLSYDHQRLTSMHRSAVETAANAEREMNIHKSKLLSTQRALQTAEAVHKQTSLELQRTKTAMQAIRTAHQTELKKKEKEFDLRAEKWQKLSDLQAKLSTAPSGISCANVSAVEGQVAKGPDYSDVALDEAEKARAALVEDNKHLKTLVLKAVNSIQRILYQTKALLSDDAEVPPTPYTTTTLFPMASATTPNEKLNALLSGLRDTLETVSDHLAAPLPLTPNPKDKASNSRAADDEIQRLQTTILSLENELGKYTIRRCQKRLENQSQEIQTMLDTFALQQRNSATELGEISMELMSVPEREEERQRLDRVREELENERAKFTEVAVKIGKEKAALEAQRASLMEEKRSWEMEKALAQRPPTPEFTPPSPPRQHHKVLKDSPRKGAFRSPKKSPRKAPAKFVISVSKPNPSNMRKATHRPKLSLSSPSKVVPSFETEVLPSFAKLSTLVPPTSLLPSAFVLPPPSPHASLPSKPALPPAAPISPPNFNMEVNNNTPNPAPVQSQESHTPTTPEPIRRPFPMAKPFAQRMVHAYSPAKPSPLSRILMLGNSPVGGLPAMPELSIVSEEGFRTLDAINEPILDLQVQPPSYEEQESMSLAAQLGVSESPPDTPLQDKKAEANITQGARPATRGRGLFPESKRPTGPATSKGKAPVSVASANNRTVASLEKENDAKKVRAGKVSPVFKAPPKQGVTRATNRTTSKSAARTNATVAATNGSNQQPATSTRPMTTSARTLPGASIGGPRRVPIDSAEAPPVTKSRKT